MAELVADCSRCGSKKITFNLLQENLLGLKYDWQRLYEAFCVCRNCKKASIFVLAQEAYQSSEILRQSGILGVKGTVNQYMRIEGVVSKKDDASIEPPQHLPQPIEAAFKEGAMCQAVNCYNAAGTMFRLCVDLATRDLLPIEESKGLNHKIRRDLGLRLPWLFENKLLPEALHELSKCIKEDGNDGAHAGTLDRADTEDMIDFTTALLERLYTEPENLRHAKIRRDARRADVSKGN